MLKVIAIGVLVYCVVMLVRGAIHRVGSEVTVVISDAEAVKARAIAELHAKLLDAKAVVTAVEAEIKSLIDSNPDAK